MKLINNIYLWFLVTKKRETRRLLKEASRELENLEQFHYLVNMDPYKYERKKKRLIKKSFSYRSQIGSMTTKINNLRCRLS